MIKEYITEGKIVPMEVTVKVSSQPFSGPEADILATRKCYARHSQEPSHFPLRLCSSRELARRQRTILD
jgi:hypothetical protein